MILLPKQSHTSVSALDTKGLDLDSEEFSRACERSLTWRGKDFQSRTWLQRWKRENWMRLLCLRTLRASHTESFVDSWTSYLAASRANPLVLLESVKELKTQDTYSPTSETELQSADLDLFSWRTSKESSQVKQQTVNQFSNMSLQSWKAWVTGQRQEYSQRVKSAHLTRENGCSSWATPEAANQVGYQVSKGKKRPRLGSQVKQWPTPTVAEGSKIGNQPNYGQKGLSNHPQIVGLPDRKKLNKSGKSRELWMTPRAGSCGSTATTVGRSKEKSTHLSGQLNHEVKQRGKLNPNWVEQLMGIPVGWTDLGSWATE